MFRVWGSRFGVRGLMIGVWDLGFGTWGRWFGAWGLGAQNFTIISFAKGFFSDADKLCAIFKSPKMLIFITFPIFCCFFKKNFLF